MEKYELEDSLKEEIRSRTLGEGFIKLVQSVRRGGGRFRISLRPVEIGGVRKYQAEMSEGRDVQVKNFDANGAAEGVEEIIAQKKLPGVRDMVLDGETGLVSAPTAEAYSSALARLMSDGGLRAKMGEKAHAYCEERYSRESVLSEWERLLSRVTGE